MGTIRIYKVAEVLGLPSHEVIDLLKREHGIEVKSASSTIEEIVARQFAERTARDRDLNLPTGRLFSETTASSSRSRTRKKGAKTPQPTMRPRLGPPRLVKTPKVEQSVIDEEIAVKTDPAPVEHTTEPFEIDEIAEPTAPAEPTKPVIQTEATPPDTDPTGAVVPTAPSATTKPAEPTDIPIPTTDTVVTEPVAAEPVVAEPVAAEPVAAEPVVAEPVVAEPVALTDSTIPAPTVEPTVIPTPRSVTPTGRVVPPTMRLRVEQQAPPLTPLTPSVTSVPPEAAVTRAQIAHGQGTAAQPEAQRPEPPRPRPGARPIGPATSRPSSPLGGSRPLSPQPARSPGNRPTAPAVGYRPSYRPPPRPPGGRKRRPSRPSTPFTPAPPPPITRTISLAEGMTVKDLAEKLDLRAKDVLKKLIERRLMMTINTTLDTETATMVAREFGAKVEMRSFEEEMLEVESTSAQEDDVSSRSPVVTVMGHVDHGKTSLLDAIRDSRVAEREAGGITQHIGAYTVEINDRRIVFLDTPGHEAFTLMRARGARVTDIVILVVAADDGVMPQTREAIDHAKAAKVPLIVAINKIDKPNANIERVKTELSELGLTAEDWGGQTVTVEVSATKQQNLDLLLEMIVLVTDLGELTANPKRSASGTVLEAKVDRGRGPVATILVKDGTLHIGDNFIAGPIVGRVRALIDDRGQNQKLAGPSSPIEVLGLTGLPQPGDTFQAVADAAKARQIAMLRQGQAKEKTLGERGGRLTLESLQQQIAETGTKELPIIVKADVQGSAEVLADTLSKLGDERVKVRLISSGAGAINEGDVVFAAASNAVIVGFNVRPDRNAASMAEREQIDIRLHRVIYDITAEIRQAMAGLLDPTVKEIQIGSAEVRDVFKVPKFGAAAGCMVVEGKLSRTGDAQARLLRDNVVIHEGRIGSLRRFKEDVNDVKNGLECGVAFERYADIKVGDVIEVFSIEKIAPTV